jgi:hypothetical protein
MNNSLAVLLYLNSVYKLLMKVLTSIQKPGVNKLNENVPVLIINWVHLVVFSDRKISKYIANIHGLTQNFLMT